MTTREIVEAIDDLIQERIDRAIRPDVPQGRDRDDLLLHRLLEKIAAGLADPEWRKVDFEE